MDHKEYRKLHAEWYEYMSGGDQSQEINLWMRFVKEAGEPVLELGSGTGKVLVALLERGIDITGIDTSEDMMARCRAFCEKKGLRPRLYEQSMLDFSLPRQFKLVILPSGSLGLFTSDKDIAAMFERVRAHLAPGGVFVYGFEPVPAKPRKNDNNWTGGWTRGAGDLIIAWRNHWRYDEGTHCWECLFVVEKFVGGKLVETEANERTGRYFSIEEAMGYAKAAQLGEIKVIDRLTEGPPRPESTSLLVTCRKAN
jgi:SAM-dependent methyltransferase